MAVAEPSYSLDAPGFSAYRRADRAARQVDDEAERRSALGKVRRERRRMVVEYASNWLRQALNRTSLEDHLVWFWFNHFNVFWQKGAVGAALPDYVDRALRPHALGRFRDLLFATMTHPAMLLYLDNARNVHDRVNENYARELLELHTLGVSAGYSQADVQAVARILTGVGLAPLRPVSWSRRWQKLVVHKGEFMFNPRLHDFSAKNVLGERIEGVGFGEVEQLCDILAKHPATFRHLAHRLSTFLAGEHVPAEEVDRVAAALRSTGGDIGSAVALLAAYQGERRPTFKDGYRWVTSAIRLLAGEMPVVDALPVWRWLRAVDQPLFGCRTPDGYPLAGSKWIGSGQLAQRFELAPAMVSAMPKVVGESWTPASALSSDLYRRQEVACGASTRAALDAAQDVKERLALLLSSPEFMYW